MQRATTHDAKTGSRLLMRGERMIASTGLAVAAIFLLSIASAGAWSVYLQRDTERKSTTMELEACGRLLARSSESLLAMDDLLSVRTLLVTTAVDHRLDQCQIRFADGSVVADASANRSAIRELPQAWPVGAANIAEPPPSKDELAGVYPIVVPGRGQAALTISRKLAYSPMAGWEAQTGLGVIGALGFAAVWVVYRRLRDRLKALGAIREALVALERGETTAAGLAISGAFGAEAGVWNELVHERERLREELSAERSKGSLSNRQGNRTDLAQACDAMWHGLLVLDEGLKIRYANGAAAVFLRAKRESVVGTTIAEHLKDAAVLEAIKSVVSGGVRRRTVVELRRTSGEGGGILRIGVRPVRRDDAAAALVVIEDVTQQRIADESRNAFVAQATHELRTPLTNIRLYTEQAIEAGDSDTALRSRALDVINQESRRLERIVGDMLSVSEIEAGTFKLRRGDVRLDALFQELEEEYRAQAAEKRITLTFALPPKLPVIKGDRDKIVLAINNLIGNALKYTPEGGKVEVRVDSNDQGLRVDVTDTGIGVSPEESELIFERFYRAKDARVSNITGTGLGLALARDVVRLHGGDINVQSQLNRGSTFTLTLPPMADAA